MLLKIKAVLLKIRFIRVLALARRKTGALGQLGWLHVNFERLEYSGNNPVPWFVYGAIDFIEHQIHPSARVLELGGGWVNRILVKPRS